MENFCEPFRSAALAGIGIDPSTSSGPTPLNMQSTSAAEIQSRGSDTAATEQTSLPIYVGKQWSPLSSQGWDNHGGRITLPGDATHSMLPHRGQGLNNAIADADYLVSAIISVVMDRDKPAQEAIDVYEAEMRPRGGKEVELSFGQAMKSRDVGTLATESPVFKVGYAKQ
jgi:2-polyprenyl-6-methoxyphenol hydroxylase-like FAD-dependent oxidoreductase